MPPLVETLPRYWDTSSAALLTSSTKSRQTGSIRNFPFRRVVAAHEKYAPPIPQLKTLQRRLANVLYACRAEIDADSDRRPLSHGFRRNLSIITNARQHKRRRYVLTLDLQDFFPTFNFGRVRGFFLRNNSFKLNDKVATLVAQIACFENGLPQGSPCSPIIADMIAHLLDVRLAQLAKRRGLTYSRYADDLTFSTSQQIFPPSIAAPVTPDSPQMGTRQRADKNYQPGRLCREPGEDPDAVQDESATCHGTDRQCQGQHSTRILPMGTR